MRAIISARTKDSFWHPLWDRYYRLHFGHVEIIELGNTYSVSFSHMTQLYNKAIEKLIEKYDLLVSVDTDEFLVPDPEKYQDLSDYLERCKGDVIRCVGYDVMEMPHQEPVNINKKITDVRTNWIRNITYDKPVIMRQKVKYTPGQHYCNVKSVQDKDLLMLHMRYADLKSLFIRRSRANLKAILDQQDSAVQIPEKWRVI